MGLSKKLHTTSYSLFTGIFFFIERMKIKTAGIDRHRKWENEGGGGGGIGGRLIRTCFFLFVFLFLSRARQITSTVQTLALTYIKASVWDFPIMTSLSVNNLSSM